MIHSSTGNTSNRCFQSALFLGDKL